MHYHCLACFGASIAETALAHANGQDMPAAIGQAIAVLDYCIPADATGYRYLAAMKCALFGNVPKNVHDSIEHCRAYRDAYIRTMKILEEFESSTQVRMYSMGVHMPAISCA